jgi:hypothetical protein
MAEATKECGRWDITMGPNNQQIIICTSQLLIKQETPDAMQCDAVYAT